MRGQEDVIPKDDRFCGHCGHLVDFQQYKGYCIFCQEQFPESDWEPLKDTKLSE